MADETVKVEIVGDASSALSALRSMSSETSKSVSDISTQFDKLSRDTNESLEKINTGFGHVARSMREAFGFVGIGFGVRALEGWIDGAIKAEKAAGDTSEQFQELAKSIDDNKEAWDKLAVTVAEKLTGLANLSKAVALGWNSILTGGELTPANQQLDQLKSKLAAMRAQFDSSGGMPAAWLDDFSKQLVEVEKQIEALRPHALDQAMGIDSAKDSLKALQASVNEFFDSAGKQHVPKGFEDLDAKLEEMDKLIADMDGQSEKLEEIKPPSKYELNNLVMKQLPQFNAQLGPDPKTLALWQNFFKGIGTGFQSVLTGFLQGTRTMQSLFKGVFDSILASVASVLAKILEQWIQTHIMTRITARLTALANVNAHAAEAGAAGVASMAGAPWPIDMGAPAFGAAMAASAASFSGVAAAERGFDVPAGVTPLTLLHPREMVLPAGIADQVRDAAGGGGRAASFTLKTQPIGKSHDLVKRSDLAALIKQMNGHFAFG